LGESGVARTIPKYLLERYTLTPAHLLLWALG
jgi:hypothetical protein